MVASLKEIETLIDALDPADQRRLLEYLTPRVASVKPLNSEPDRSWEEFCEVASRLAAMPEGESITQAVSDMRR